MPYPDLRAGQRVTPGLLSSLLPLRVIKLSDESRSSNATMTTDSALSIDVVAGATYQFEGYVSYSQNLGVSSTAGIRIGWVAPADSTLIWSSDGTDSQTSLTGQDVTSQPLSAIRSLPANGVTAMRAAPTGLLTIGSVGGTFGLQWAQISSSATQVIVRAGSWLRLIRVS